MELKLSRPIIFLDLETTGLNIFDDRIVMIAMIKLFPDGSEMRYKQIITPQIEIPDEVIAIHGISNEDVADAPVFDSCLVDIQGFLANADLAGYNLLRFDLPILVESFARAGVELNLDDHKFIDVLSIFRKKESRSLVNALMFYCGETLENAHDAEADALATSAVLSGQLKRYDDLPNTVDALAETFTSSYYHQVYDWHGRLYKADKGICFAYGPYKHQLTCQVFKDDPQYIQFLLDKERLSIKARGHLQQLIQDS